jgi:Mg-chelatase subunit ChlD
MFPDTLRSRPVAAVAAVVAAALVAAWFIVPAHAQSSPAASRSVELILDVSGSMAGKIPDGRTKIDAARTAVQVFLDALPAATRLAFRAYGHQSPREKHDCNDTALILPFGVAAAMKTEVLAKARTLTPQGYTPITKVLEVAAKDFSAADKNPKFIVLVSDGKETCDGDPCATARALKAAGAGVVVHTIGFDVDKAARTQLECVSRATGGTYFDAPDANLLAAAIAKAAVQGEVTLAAEPAGQGFLSVKGAELQGHDVADAATGKVVASIGALKATIPLPSGLYHVKFGRGWWKSVEVKTGRTTILEPAVLRVKGAAYHGNHIIDAESGVEHGLVSSVDETATLMPGTYDVTFEKLIWPGVRLESGQTVTLLPGIVTVKGLNVTDVPVATEAGVTVGTVSALSSTIVLPAGTYRVLLTGSWRSFTVAEGQTLTISVK